MRKRMTTTAAMAICFDRRDDGMTEAKVEKKNALAGASCRGLSTPLNARCNWCSDSPWDLWYCRARLSEYYWSQFGGIDGGVLGVGMLLWVDW